jgi:hypothetical protein
MTTHMCLCNVIATLLVLNTGKIGEKSCLGNKACYFAQRGEMEDLKSNN